MLTSDPIYYKPLLPVITIKNTANNTGIYSYNSFTDVGTTDKVISSTVSLSQSTHGTFSVTFEDQNKSLEPSGVTVGNRVLFQTGKQSSSLTSLLSGLVRKKGYARGSDGKVLYTISGSSTGIRLNELLIYAVSQARTTGDGSTPDITDATRKADLLLQTSLETRLSDIGGVISVANLAANSDVETFIESLSIEYGYLQDMINYIQDQSGGLVITDTSDIVNFRYEIKNQFFGRGFTIKNQPPSSSGSIDDADDTMYLRGRNWTMEDDFYNSSDYSNKVTSLMTQEASRPSQMEDLGFDQNRPFGAPIGPTREYAVKFRPTHTVFYPGDIYFIADSYNNVGGGESFPWDLMICKDNNGLPQNIDGIVVRINFYSYNWDVPFSTVPNNESPHLCDKEFFIMGANPQNNQVVVTQFSLDTTKDYWLIFSNGTGDVKSTYDFYQLYQNIKIPPSNNIYTHTSNFTNHKNGGSSWISAGNVSPPCFDLRRFRSMAFEMWDPKAAQKTQQGITKGQFIESLLPDASIQIKNRNAMYRHMAGQLYAMARPKTTYIFDTVTAPNIAPVPGDPIIISDSVLGISTPNNPILLGSCGDMTYTWGDYEAPTNLSITVVSIPPRYR